MCATAHLVRHRVLVPAGDEDAGRLNEFLLAEALDLLLRHLFVLIWCLGSLLIQIEVGEKGAGLVGRQQAREVAILSIRRGENDISYLNKN